MNHYRLYKTIEVFWIDRWKNKTQRMEFAVNRRNEGLFQSLGDGAWYQWLKPSQFQAMSPYDLLCNLQSVYGDNGISVSMIKGSAKGWGQSI